MTLDNAVLYTISSSALAGRGSMTTLAGQLASVSGSRCLIVVVGASKQEHMAMGAKASGLGPAADVHRRAGLMALAPQESAQRFAGLVSLLGVDVELLDPLTHAPITRGSPLEAEPRLLNAKRFESASGSSKVLVLPGGVGRTPQGEVTSLGSGGATLTGLFIAQRLGLPARIVVGENAATDPLPKRSKLFARRHGVEFERVTTIGRGSPSLSAVSA